MQRAHQDGSTQRSPRLWLASLLLSSLSFAMVASHCKQATSGPVGYGLMQFAGYQDSRVLDDSLALGVNPLVDWAQLEPQEGVYDWSRIDAVLEAAHFKDKRVALRVYSNKGEFGQSTPDWVFDAGAQSFADRPGSARQPVPTDPVFTAKFERFLAEFGRRYNGHPDIEFVQTNAGMGTWGEMVWGSPDEYRPPGWSPAAQVATSRAWIDRWRAAFPSTALVLMENAIGFDIVQQVADYAVSRGFYLQANDPNHPSRSQEIMARYADRTRIILEIENGGCRTSSGPAFDGVVDQVFAPGFPIDYLMICAETFDDDGRAQRAFDRLRRIAANESGG